MPNAKLMKKCHEGKRRFNTIEEAKSTVNSLIRHKKKQGNDIVTFMRAYGCACGGFHFGKTRGINWDAIK